MVLTDLPGQAPAQQLWTLADGFLDSRQAALGAAGITPDVEDLADRRSLEDEVRLDVEMARALDPGPVASEMRSRDTVDGRGVASPADDGEEAAGARGDANGVDDTTSSDVPETWGGDGTEGSDGVGGADQEGFGGTAADNDGNDGNPGDFNSGDAA
ncbi:hypothetical protein, partial [Nocardioides plantarum]